MSPLDGNALRASLTAVRDLFARVPDGAAAVPVVGTSVIGVAHHLGGCLAWYAHDLAAGPAQVTSADLVSRSPASLATVAAGVDAWGEVLARTVDAAGPTDRGWHSHGAADAAGFAAIGCAELLVHGSDVADAGDLDWSPPVDVAGAVLARLFPDAGEVTDPLTGLLWATGRIDLPSRARHTAWTYAMTPPGART